MIGRTGYLKKFINYIILYIYTYIKLVLVGGTEEILLYNWFFFLKLLNIIYRYSALKLI